jgi:hypothetical protein
LERCLRRINLSARNLYEFLNNKGSNNEVKRHEYAGYARTFQLSSISGITGTLQMLNEQVFHMGRKRPTNRDGKVTLERIDKVFNWTEKNVLELVASFDETFSEKIQMHRADPNYSDGMLHIGEAEAKILETSSNPFKLKSGTHDGLSAQNHTSHVMASFHELMKNS